LQFYSETEIDAVSSASPKHSSPTFWIDQQWIAEFLAWRPNLVRHAHCEGNVD